MKRIELNVLLVDDFVVTDEWGTIVTGIPIVDFTAELYDPAGNEVSSSYVITITELGNGKYRITFLPNILGDWILTVYHSLYFPAGKTANYNCTLLETNVEEIKDKTDLIPSDIQATLDQISLDLARVLGLTHENIVQEHSFTGNIHTGTEVYLYDSKANALLNDKVTGIVAQYTLTINLNTSGIPLSHTMVKN